MRRYFLLENIFRQISGLKYKIYKEEDIPLSYKQKIGKEIWFGTKGGGYWSWKLWIIQKHLSTMAENDILIYIDGGCDINILKYPTSIPRLAEYIEMVNDPNKCGLLRFELDYIEKLFTNQYMLDYICKKYNITNDNLYIKNTSENPMIAHSPYMPSVALSTA